MSKFKHAPFIEPSVPPEFFVSDLPAVERFGSFVRLTFAAPEVTHEGAASLQLSGVVKLIVPADALAEMIARIAEPQEIEAPPSRRAPTEKPKLVPFEKPHDRG